jgi:DNA-binding transcriptional regulator YdaS (Cro superfamily)
MQNSLDKIITLLGTGGQSKLADCLKTERDPVSQAHVWKWLNTTVNGIPEKHVIKACSAVNYQVTPHELRPDIYPHPDDGLPEHLRQVA